MDTIEIILLVITSLLALLFIAIRTFRGGIAGVIFKTLASFAFVATSIVGLMLSDSTGNIKIAMGLISIGLLLGMIGDIILDLKVIYEGNDKWYLNTGMLSFGLGHCAYFAAFTLIALENNTKLLSPILIGVGSAVVLTALTMFASKPLKLNFGKFLWQTVGYSFILNFMVVFSLVLAIMGGGSWLVFVGLLLFLLSDLVLSNQYFGGQLHNKVFIAVNHALYYAAQIIIMAVVLGM
jgi:uncharacterized membrane protein YhhN